MSMFCFQCQETAKGVGCTINGVCGKKKDTANLQDLLIYVAKGISYVSIRGKDLPEDIEEKVNKFLLDALFTTITNVNFNSEDIKDKIEYGLKLKRDLIKLGGVDVASAPEAARWDSDRDEFDEKAEKVGILNIKNEDERSLKELIVYGIKGIAAYAEHAYVLGFQKREIFEFIKNALSKTLENLSVEELIDLVFETGKYSVEVMALLDEANTSTYGHPEITEVNLGVDKNPGILISGHDLKDLEELLEQSKDSGVDIYTHGEMLPAQYYPAFKKYSHFKGNYGNAWWKQNEEFEKFNGPILMTTNCLVPPRDSYKDRVYTTGVVSFPGCKHIPDRENGKPKDFSEIIEHAKRCQPPQELERGKIIGGFAHNQVFALADKIVDAVKSGAIKKFVVMAGCDGRMKSREYYTEFAKKLPEDTVILTAGCAKYRYNKLNLGDINGIPRVLDAGQCNDSYSLVVVAMKLKEIFNLNDINELPIIYNIAWYEQKAVTVLLALLYLGVKNIHLGPTLPAFLSPTVLNFLVEKFNVSTISNVDDDMRKFFG